MAHGLDIDAHLVGQVRQFIHEGNTRGQHGVRRVLCEFGRAHVHPVGAFAVAVEWRVQAFQQFARALAVRRAVAADDDAVRAHEIFDGRAFLEKFRVRRHRERGGHAARVQFTLDGGAHFFGRADGHGGLVDDDLEVRHVLADAARGRQHVLQVGRAVFIGRRADGDELHHAVRGGCLDVSGKGHAAGGAVARHDFFQARFMDGNAAAVEQGDLLCVQVEAKNVVAQFRQAGARHEAHIAGADNGDFHGCAVFVKIDAANKYTPRCTKARWRVGLVHDVEFFGAARRVSLPLVAARAMPVKTGVP